MEPLLAATRAYEAVDASVTVRWDFTPLADFERGTELRPGAGYDLVTFDHPHVETIATNGLLHDLTGLLTQQVVDGLAADAVGASHLSYVWNGQVFGVRLDAAATFAVRRVDVAEPQAKTLEGVIDEITRSRGTASVLLPLVPTHAGALLVSLMINMGADVAAGWPGFDSAQARAAVELMQRVWPYVLPDSVRLNPIQVLDTMVRNPAHAYSPFVFGYAPYADQRRGDGRLVFGPSPGVLGGDGLRGMLGGAGLGVHRESAHPEAAAALAAWLGSASVQRSFFVPLGGQPAAWSAWRAGCDDPHFGGFFTGTKAAMKQAFLRPRATGFAAMQAEAGRILVAGLLAGKAATALCDELATAEQAMLTHPSSASVP
ncbi:hypothetical protein ACQBAU_04930 [Propionibacteriaceae bacterium Y2011]